MDVNEVYNLVKYIVNKNQQGYVSPSQFNEVINQAQKSYASYLLGSIQAYMPGRPVARVELGQNATIRQRLSPIIVTNAQITLNPQGYAPYPSDYAQMDSVVNNQNQFQRVRFVQQDSIYSYYNSVIDPVSSNPIYVLEDTGFRVYPQNLSTVTISYVRVPPDISWGYDLDPNGRPVYNPNSTPPLLPPQVHHHQRGGGQREAAG